MKFLHTADLHIGKRTEGRLRLDEQRAVLDEIAAIAKTENVDLALIAGDVFDVVSPSAEAKRLFYRFALDLADVCPVLAIAGNHDGAAELSAPSELADAAEIKLIGRAMAYDSVAGGEPVHVAALPYPDEGALRPFEGSYTERMQALIAETCGNFRAGENNIFLSHLFMSGSNEEAEENTLGPARMLPKTVLPAGCYTALGHIHKPSVVSRSGNAYYAGSPLPYHFDGDRNGEKSVIVAEMRGGDIVDVRRVPLSSGRKLVVEEVDDFAAAAEALERNEGNLVKLRYVSSVPLTMSETKTLKSFECFVKLEAVARPEKEAGERATVKTKSDEELFSMYYEKKNGAKPSDGLRTLFADILAEAKGAK